MLKIENLKVIAGKQVILSNVNLEIKRNEVHVLLGPNGAGKSTLLMAIMGHPAYSVEGKLLFNGIDLKNLKPFERAKLGIALALQNPPKIRVKFSYMADRICEKYGSFSVFESYAINLRVRNLLGRDLFYGFSGGEIKRSELLLTLLQTPKLAMLDEPDSGVDVDSLAIVGRAINSLIERGAAVLLVTHLGHVLRYVNKVDCAHVMINGTIVYSGNYKEIIDNIMEHGYDFYAGVSNRDQ